MNKSLPNREPTNFRPKFYGILNHQPLPSLCTIEVASALQIPGIQILGLPGPSIQESKDRVRSAIAAGQFKIPSKRFFINLSPSDVRKSGTLLDLPIALSLLFYTESDTDLNGQAKSPSRRILTSGALSLDGAIHDPAQPLRLLFLALQEKIDAIMIPKASRDLFIRLYQEYFPFEARQNKLRIYAADCLTEAYTQILLDTPLEIKLNPEGSSLQKSRQPPKRVPNHRLSHVPSVFLEALKIGLSGHHHMLLLGPKGTGKTSAIDFIESVFPQPEKPEILKRNLMCELSDQSGIRCQPSLFRRLNPSIRPQSLLGGFTQGLFMPGELALAHQGVLIADEFPEWSRDSREILRQPLQEGFVSLQRREGHVEYPCDFLFLATGNLCPCGGVYREKIYAFESQCRCSHEVRRRYLSRLEGPILDRIDLRVLLDGSYQKVEFNESRVQEEIEQTRHLAFSEYGSLPGKLKPQQLEDILKDQPSIGTTLDQIHHESLRDRHKILRIGLTQRLIDPKLDLKDLKSWQKIQKFRFRPCEFETPSLGFRPK